MCSAQLSWRSPALLNLLRMITGRLAGRRAARGTGRYAAEVTASLPHNKLFFGARPGFLQRDPAALAAEADLGADGIAEVAYWQDIYQQFFDLLGEEDWSHHPEGHLANHWRGVGGAQSTHYLINIARLIVSLMGSASPGIDGTIKQRLRTILRTSDSHAYEEALVELEVGGMVAARISPVLLEPLVPEHLRSKPNPPMSPDYGVRVPEGLVTIEVTVWHWEAYAAWRRMYDALHKTLSMRMLKRGVSRRVDIELPLGAPQEVVKKLWSNEFCNVLSHSSSGAVQIPVGAESRPIEVAWHPLSHPEIEEASGGRLVTLYGNVLTGHQFGICVNPRMGDDERNLALASLRRSIDRKKRQCNPKLPHLLAISPVYTQIAVAAGKMDNTWKIFTPLIEVRLWPNDRYSWLSGLLLCTPNRTAPRDNVSYFIGYSPNPNAAVPAPESITRAMTGQAEFHTMWQRPRRTAENL